jgi:hypothetical protein
MGRIEFRWKIVPRDGLPTTTWHGRNEAVSRYSLTSSPRDDGEWCIWFTPTMDPQHVDIPLESPVLCPVIENELYPINRGYWNLIPNIKYANSHRYVRLTTTHTYHKIKWIIPLWGCFHHCYPTRDNCHLYFHWKTRLITNASIGIIVIYIPAFIYIHKMKSEICHTVPNSDTKIVETDQANIPNTHSPNCSFYLVWNINYEYTN